MAGRWYKKERTFVEDKGLKHEFQNVKLTVSIETRVSFSINIWSPGQSNSWNESIINVTNSQRN